LNGVIIGIQVLCLDPLLFEVLMPHILTSIIVPTTNVQCKIICKGLIGKKRSFINIC